MQAAPLMPRALVLLMIAAVGTAAGAAPPAPPDVDAVLAKLDDLYRSKTSIARIEISVSSPRASRTLRLRAWTRGEDEALIVIESPAREAGIATLRVGQNLWNYLPKVSRTIRVPPSMMLASWMGTDFTNDDLVRESSYRQDYASRIVGFRESPRGWQIVSEAKPGVVARWARIEMLVTEEEWLPVEMRYFDRKGRLARTATFDEVRLLDGRRLPARMTMVPADATQQRTEMRYLDVDFDAAIPDDTFSLSRLERTR